MVLLELEKHIIKEKSEEIKKLITGGKNTLTLDFSRLSENIRKELTENFTKYIHSEKTLNDITTGVFNAISTVEGGGTYKNVALFFKNVTPFKKIREILSDDINKLITINGTIISVTSPHVYIKEGKFICPKCQTPTFVKQTIGSSEIVQPNECVCGWKRGFIHDEVGSVWGNYQEIIIQENPDEVVVGVVPRTERGRIMTTQLIDSCKPGDLVNIVCTLIPIPIKKGKGKIFGRIIEINSVEMLNKDSYNLELTEDDEIEIYNISLNPNIYTHLSNSIFPSLYGREDVKLGTILALFGGVEVKKEDITRRGNIHVLMIGDPGVGKSRMLEAIRNAAPKAVHAVGKGASGVGLTAAVVQDQLGWTLRAGSLVLADMGTCCFDEIDKVTPEQLQHLYEALSDQTVTITKATIHTTMRARTSMIAAANPTFGRYDDSKIITENVSISPVLLSRFDLIFIMKDTPNEDEDREIFNKIFEIEDTDKILLSREVIKKYILYAKRIKPKMTKEAGQKLADFYIPLRKQSVLIPDTPITISPRQLEGLKRLSEAAARVELSEEVLPKHAELAITLFKNSLKGWGFDPVTGKMDVVAIQQSGQTTSKAKRERMFNEYLKNQDRVVHFKEICEALEGYGIDSNEIIGFLNKGGHPRLLGDFWYHIDNPHVGSKALKASGKAFKGRLDNYIGNNE